jgi:hypothetical protein
MLTSSVIADVRACCLSSSMVGRAVLTAPRRSEDARNVPTWATSCSALGTARPTPIRSDSLANTPVSRRLGFGHSGLVNPQGCQRVAGGRPGLWGRRPPGNRAGDVLHPGRGARPASEPARADQGAALTRTFHAPVAADVSRRHFWCGKSAPTDVGGYSLLATRAECMRSGLAPLLDARSRTRLSGGRSPLPLNVASPASCRRFPLSPSEGERAGVRGPSLGSGVQSASKCQGVLTLNDHRLPSGNPATNEARRQS